MAKFFAGVWEVLKFVLVIVIIAAVAMVGCTAYKTYNQQVVLPTQAVDEIVAGECSVTLPDGSFGTVTVGNAVTNMQTGAMHVCQSDGSFEPPFTMVEVGEEVGEGSKNPANDPPTEEPADLIDEEITISGDDSCGVTVISEGEAFKWRIDLTVGGDDKYPTAGMVSDANHNLVLIVEAGLSADLEGANMSGRLYILDGSADQIACYMDSLVGGNPAYTRWYVGDNAPNDWTSTPPSDWTTMVSVEQIPDDLVEVEGFAWDDKPIAIGPANLTIGGDGAWYRCEMWRTDMPGHTWDTLIQNLFKVMFSEPWQGQCWRGTGSNFDITALFQLSEQRSWQHEQRMRSGNAFSSMSLMFVGDSANMANSFLITDITATGGGWLHAQSNLPAGWTVVEP